MLEVINLSRSNQLVELKQAFENFYLDDSSKRVFFFESLDEKFFMQESRTFKGPRSRRKNNFIESNRIQKLLASEYREFFDSILVESPFAETTRNGRGIRQVSLGLTSSKLIVAADVFTNNSRFYYPSGIDPSIESLELISVYPLKYVNLSIFRRRHRKALKARFIDGRANYYELGGTQRKIISWKIWCDQVEILRAKKVDGSSLSETTAASSSSTSTLYVFSSEIEVQECKRQQDRKCVCRVWAHYGGAGDHISPTWPQKDLYLGASYNELNSDRYAPVPVRFAGASWEDVKDELKDNSSKLLGQTCHSWPNCQNYQNRKKIQSTGGLCDVLYIRDHNRKCYNTRKFLTTCQCSPCNDCQDILHYDGFTKKQISRNNNETWMNPLKIHEDSIDLKKITLAQKISRFGFGVPEKCGSCLVLGPCRGDQDYQSSKYTLKTAYTLIESAVEIWERKSRSRASSSSRRHQRKYGLCSAAHFLHALGPWSIQPGERDVFQGRRSFSLVAIRRKSNDPDLKLPVSHRQLGTSVSCSTLVPDRFGNIGTTVKGKVVLFWTPEYWYRPRPAVAAYRELRQHLNNLQSFRQEKENQAKRKLFCRRKKCTCDGKESYTLLEAKPSILDRIFSGNVGSKKKKKERRCQESNTTVQLRKLLRMDFRITVWDLDSTTMATQLTVIDRDLFTRIPVEEIESLIFNKTLKNASNLGAWIAFGHRISCLTATEILAVRKLEMRSRMIARLINVANKCFAMGNFHSCRSVLAGLQAPPIYRLRVSWDYLRIHHATRYETMERLCKIYKNTCNWTYRRAWAKAETSPPCLPYVGDVLTRLLGLSETKFPGEFTRYCDAKKALYLQLNTLVDPSTFYNNNNYKEHAESSALGNNNEAVNAKRDVAKGKQGIGKRILAALLAKIKFRGAPTMCCEKKEDSWTPRREDLARKYFTRWNNIVLRNKIWANEEERLRKMDARRRRILEVASWLTDCQRYAQEYDFPAHLVAREFLLKARYREDRENFLVSLKLEPTYTT